ncbi:MAG: transposase [bacterium]
MITGVKVRLIPDKEQEKLLWQSSGTARWAYNWCLDKQINNYKNGGKFIPDGVMRKELTELKKSEEYKWLNNISAQIPKQAIKDCCNAFKKFFNKESNFPKFKSRKKSIPSFYNDTHKLSVKETSVLIEKVGWIELSEDNRIPVKSDKIKYYNPRITHDGKYWYISAGIDEKVDGRELSDKSIGIDVGISSLAICSNGIKFKNINKTKKVKKLKKKLKRFQRQVSRKYLINKEGEKFAKTNNIIKLERKIKLLHRRLKNIRNNYIHQSTSTIVKTKPRRIIMETLNISGMMKNKHLSKAIQEQCLYKFKETLRYKCEKYGIQFIEADKFYPSSKMCSHCGYIRKDLKLSDRTYICPECGLVIDRDYNASINLEHYEVPVTQSS